MFRLINRRERQDGFTLIELLIVMALLGVLVAVLLPKYQDLTPEAKIAATQGNLQAIQAAVVFYQAKHPNDPMPPSFAALLDHLRKIPQDKITPGGSSDTTTATGTDASVLAGASGAGGWLLNLTTGTVWCNVGSTTIGTLTVNPLTDW